MRERLVIPTYRHEPVEMLGDSQKISFKRREGILRSHFHSIANGSNTGTDVGNAIHIHQAVRAFSGDTKQSAGPVVFKAATENPLPVTIKRSGDRIAVLGLDRFRLEMKLQCFSPGRYASSTSFETVLRTASNHWRQPER